MNYDAVYDFMNCEEENPCWGWLNLDREVRLNTTKISNSLNDMYQVSIDWDVYFLIMNLSYIAENCG